MPAHKELAPLLNSEPIQTEGNGGSYTIDGKGLDQIAREYVSQLNRFDNFSIDHPLPQLTTTGILVTPVSGDTLLDTQSVPMSNALTVVPTPTPLPPPAPAAALPAAPPVEAPRRPPPGE